MLLAFGTLRADKNLIRLCEAFQAAQLENAALVIAGRPWNNALAQELVAHAKADPRIRVIAEHVPSDRVSELFAAADLAVVARTDGGTSGVAVLTLSLGVPLLAADLPAARELIAHDQAGWLFEPRGQHGLRAALEQIGRERDILPGKQLAARTAGARLSWEATAPTPRKFSAVSSDRSTSHSIEGSRRQMKGPTHQRCRHLRRLRPSSRLSSASRRPLRARRQNSGPPIRRSSPTYPSTASRPPPIRDWEPAPPRSPWARSAVSISPSSSKRRGHRTRVRDSSRAKRCCSSCTNRNTPPAGQPRRTPSAEPSRSTHLSLRRWA